MLSDKHNLSIRIESLWKKIINAEAVIAFNQIYIYVGLLCLLPELHLYYANPKKKAKY